MGFYDENLTILYIPVRHGVIRYGTVTIHGRQRHMMLLLLLCRSGVVLDLALRHWLDLHQLPSLVYMLLLSVSYVYMSDAVLCVVCNYGLQAYDSMRQYISPI